MDSILDAKDSQDISNSMEHRQKNLIRRQMTSPKMAYTKKREELRLCSMYKNRHRGNFIGARVRPGAGLTGGGIQHKWNVRTNMTSTNRRHQQTINFLNRKYYHHFRIPSNLFIFRIWPIGSVFSIDGSQKRKKRKMKWKIRF